MPSPSPSRYLEHVLVEVFENGGRSLVELVEAAMETRALPTRSFPVVKLGPPQPVGGRILQIAGLSYTWDSSVPEGGNRVVEVRDGSGTPLSLSASYVVAANNFIASGGDSFTVLKSGTNQVGGPVALDALVAYIKTLAQPFSAAISGRITRN